MIKYLGENNIVFAGIVFVFLAGIFEFLEVIRNNNSSKKEKKVSCIIAICYIIEGIIFLIPFDNVFIDIMCTLFGMLLFASLGYRYLIRKNKI